jgi:hypothetical protein
MSYLVVDAFNDDFTTVDTGFRALTGSMIEAIRFKMIKYGTIADGTLTLDVINDDSVVIGTQTVTAAQFNTISGTYAHGYIGFIFNEPICINKSSEDTYIQLTLRLTMSGHTEDTNNYVGLIKQFDDPFVTEYGSRQPTVSPEVDGWFNPYGVEVYSVQR